MKRLTLAMGFTAVAAVAAAGCGGGNQQAPPAESTPAAGAPAAAPSNAAGPIDITLANQSQPVKTGENTFEVMVMQGTQPVTDADVSLDFYMAAMPQMKMPEMKNSIALKHEGGGRYMGTGNVMTAGNWDTTVMVMRGGQELGTRKLTVTAK